MPERRRPRYPLGTIKTAFADLSRLNRTVSAAEGADALDMDDRDVIEVIARLTARDFEKSMLSEVDPTIWQDVYKPVVGGRELYIKFTLDGRGSF
jgi:hypothetical protein